MATVTAARAWHYLEVMRFLATHNLQVVRAPRHAARFEVMRHGFVVFRRRRHNNMHVEGWGGCGRVHWLARGEQVGLLKHLQWQALYRAVG